MPAPVLTRCAYSARSCGRSLRSRGEEDTCCWYDLPATQLMQQPKLVAAFFTVNLYRKSRCEISLAHIYCAKHFRCRCCICVTEVGSYLLVVGLDNDWLCMFCLFLKQRMRSHSNRYTDVQDRAWERWGEGKTVTVRGSSVLWPCCCPTLKRYVDLVLSTCIPGAQI